MMRPRQRAGRAIFVSGYWTVAFLRNRWRKVNAIVRMLLSMATSRPSRVDGQHDRPGDEQVQDGQRQEHLPAEAHELVVAGPRQRAADEDEEGDEAGRLQEEPDDRRQEPGPQPAAEEQGRGQGRDQRQTQVFPDIEHAELHAGVLRMVAGHELVLRFGQVERQAPDLGRPGDEEDGEPGALRHGEPKALLGQDDLAQVEGAGDHDHAHEREAHEHLVAHHLGGRPQPAEERVFVVRRPGAEDDAVDRERRHGQKEEQADVQIDDREARGEGDDGEGHQDGRDDDGRGQDEDRPVGERRHPVFLEEELDHIGQHLEDAEGADPVGAIALLPEAEQAALQPDEARGDPQRHGQDADDGQDHLQGEAHGFLTALIRPRAGRSSPSPPPAITGTPTTPRAMSAVTLAGSDSASPPASRSTVSPSPTPNAAASSGQIRSRGSGMSVETASAKALSSSEPKMWWTATTSGPASAAPDSARGPSAGAGVSTDAGGSTSLRPGSPPRSGPPITS